MERRAEIGIEALAVAVPRHYLDLGALAEARGVEPAKYSIGLGTRRMAVPFPDEDSVVLAVRAARALLESYDIDPRCIGMASVGTETGVDCSKPIATYVHRWAGLPPDCRTFDVQHACYGATAALRLATAWVASGQRPGRKALVVATDIAKYDVGSPGEPTQGAAAVAMLVGDEPRVLAVGQEPEAVYSEEVQDFWRPTYRATALADGHFSMECYLRAAERCSAAMAAASGRDLAEVDYMLFHAPFPKMARKAHRRLWDTAETKRPGTVEEDYERRVEPALWANRQVGNAYTASLYVSLAGLLENRHVRVAESEVSLFSYGSGSCAELFAGRIGADATAFRGKTGLLEALAEREEIDYPTYLDVRRAAEERARNGERSFEGGGASFSFLGVAEHMRTYFEPSEPTPGSVTKGERLRGPTPGRDEARSSRRHPRRAGARP